jgi:hypothetical protein
MIKKIKKDINNFLNLKIGEGVKIKKNFIDLLKAYKYGLERREIDNLCNRIKETIPKTKKMKFTSLITTTSLKEKITSQKHGQDKLNSFICTRNKHDGKSVDLLKRYKKRVKENLQIICLTIDVYDKEKNYKEIQEYNLEFYIPKYSYYDKLKITDGDKKGGKGVLPQFEKIVNNVCLLHNKFLVVYSINDIKKVNFNVFNDVKNRFLYKSLENFIKQLNFMGIKYNNDNNNVSTCKSERIYNNFSNCLNNSIENFEKIFYCC